jgi:hypothetical protein
MITSVKRFAKSSEAVEAGFLAAGITVATLAAVQAGATLLTWIAFAI